jgi:hypothetical protein
VQVPARSREAIAARLGVYVASAAAGDEPLADQRAEERDAQATGEMVVARASTAKGVGARPLAQRSHRRYRREPGKRLDEVADLRARERVVAMASLRADGHEARLEQAGEMAAGR